MDSKQVLTGEHCPRQAEWADGWAVVADPVKFAARFSATVPGAYRHVTGDDIRQMAQCGLIGRCGFFDRSDLETVRGILLYEQHREDAARQKTQRELVHAVLAVRGSGVQADLSFVSLNDV